jgi:hypothetical protein
VNKGEVFIGAKSCEQGLADSVNDFYSVISSEFPNSRVVNMAFKDKTGGMIFSTEAMDGIMYGNFPREVLDELTGYNTDDLAVQLRAKIDL